MKIKLFYLGVFILAFLLGILTILPFLNQPAAQNAFNQVRQTEIPDLRAKANEGLEVFDVGDEFFEERPDNRIKMLETGKGLRLDKVNVRSGDKMLGLFYEGDKTVLKNSTVTVTNDKKGWKNISVANKTEPRFLVKPGTFREGKVVTTFSGFSSNDDEPDDFGYETISFDQLKYRTFQVGDNTYSFSLKKGLSRSGKNVLVLLLENEENRQIINLTYYGGDYGSSEPYMGDNLLWAGDLDHDNKLDFYMEFFNEKGSYWTGLFLSSKAEKGKLVKLAGGFSTMGC